MLSEETRIAVLETKVSGLQDRVDDLKGSINSIDQKIDARFEKFEQKLDNLFAMKNHQAGVMRVVDWFWRLVGPALAAIGGVLYSKHGL
jgi:chaperonin cofactor prefoldin